MYIAIKLFSLCLVLFSILLPVLLSVPSLYFFFYAPPCMAGGGENLYILHMQEAL